jgi:hypothetical protein
MLTSALGALILLPLLIVGFQPGFIVGSQMSKPLVVQS